jgi:hypothetical protein
MANKTTKSKASRSRKKEPTLAKDDLKSIIESGKTVELPSDVDIVKYNGRLRKVHKYRPTMEHVSSILTIQAKTEKGKMKFMISTQDA